jgi:hypothetical protein
MALYACGCCLPSTVLAQLSGSHLTGRAVGFAAPCQGLAANSLFVVASPSRPVGARSQYACDVMATSVEHRPHRNRR